MNILLVGCCKNIEFNIEIIKKNFYNLSEKINICKGVFYENNSTDNTSFILKNWEHNESNIKVISEYYSETELLNMCKASTYNNKPCRIEIISMARNKILEEIEKDIYNDIDFVIMYDMDHKILLPIENIINVLNKNYNFDALICKGNDQCGDIYDTYSYKDHTFLYGSEILGEDSGYLDILKQINYRNKEGLIPVLSAFNGMCIYKKSSIKNIRYTPYPSKALDKIYRESLSNIYFFNKTKEEILNIEKDLYDKYGIKLLKSVSDIYKNFEKNNSSTNIINTDVVKHINGSLQGVYLFGDDGIFYKNCNGYNYPIVCEHIIFHLEMREKGYGNIYICNELEWSSIWYDGLKGDIFNN